MAHEKAAWDARRRDLTTALFDFDGTLVRLFAGIGTEAIAERIRVRCRKERVDADLMHCTGDPFEIWRRACRQLAPHDPERARDLSRSVCEMMEAYECQAALSAELLPDAENALRRVRMRGCSIGIVTNNSRSAVESALSRFDLLPYCHTIAARHDPELSKLKPNPELVLAALRDLGASPHQAFLIGDSCSDILASDAAGVLPIGIDADGTKSAEFRSALRSLSSKGRNEPAHPPAQARPVSPDRPDQPERVAGPAAELSPRIEVLARGLIFRSLLDGLDALLQPA